MGNKNSKAGGQSSGATVALQQINVQRVQNVLLIWLDSKIDNNNADCHNRITRLRRTVNDVHTFTDNQKCIEFINTITDTKACMIVSGSLGQHIVPRIHNMSQVDSFFILCSNKKFHEQWAKNWTKIKGVFNEIELMCETLKQAAQQCEQNAISISLVATDGDMSKKNLDQLDPMFMYSQIVKDVVLKIKFDEEHIKKFIDHCRDVFAENDQELRNLTKLQTKYRSKTPIWWYTSDSFLYPMLNCAFRLMDIDIIIKMGFFIFDLHRHIQQLHSKQFIGKNSNKPFTVYRGQGLSKTDFDKMKNIQGGLMSFNNFLLTSKNRQVSLGFALRALSNEDMMGIFFVMTIDPMNSTTPFASIVDIGFDGDEKDEVLFSIHTIFRIGEITPVDKTQRLFQVQLTLTSDKEKDLRILSNRIREEAHSNEEGWYQLGSLLLKVGESAKAQQLYEILLEQTTDAGEKGRIYQLLGWIKDNEGKYNEAIKFYESALEIYIKTLSPTALDLANCYNNIGSVYFNMDDYPKALSYYEKALGIQEQSLPANHPALGSSYNNIGLMYFNMSDYPKALLSHEKALEIRQRSLPANHPALGSSYNNIGLVSFNMGDYPKALSFYEKALEIKQQTLSSNNPDLTFSYNNIGNVYHGMGEYPKALSYYEQVLEIQKQSLPSNHPDLGMTYNNIGEVYFNMGDYPEARSFYERAVEIGQYSLPANHPQLCEFRNNLDIVKKKL